MQPIDIRVLGTQRYLLLDEVHYKDAKWKIVVYRGFDFDGASIPRGMWTTIGCPMDYVYAAAIHDALYASRLLDRKSCDKIFYNALLMSGVDKALALTMYLAVRAGGQAAYDEGDDVVHHYRDYVSVLPH
jgi:hypothetical protein